MIENKPKIIILIIIFLLLSISVSTYAYAMNNSHDKTEEYSINEDSPLTKEWIIDQLTNIKVIFEDASKEVDKVKFENDVNDSSKDFVLSLGQLSEVLAYFVDFIIKTLQ